MGSVNLTFKITGLTCNSLKPSFNKWFMILPAVKAFTI